eukprot:6186198-Pleurochrysis_carterae.AAC.1
MMMRARKQLAPPSGAFLPRNEESPAQDSSSASPVLKAATLGPELPALVAQLPAALLPLPTTPTRTTVLPSAELDVAECTSGKRPRCLCDSDCTIQAEHTGLCLTLSGPVPQSIKIAHRMAKYQCKEATRSDSNLGRLFFGAM